jgi:hypothetical protein
LSEAYKEQDEHIECYDSDTPALAAFEEGLMDPTIRILTKARADTLEEAIELAILEERRKKSRVANQPNKIRCTFCCESEYPLSECLKFKKENNICQNCKCIGHFPSDCPDKNKIQQNLEPFQEFNDQDFNQKNFDQQDSRNRNNKYGSEQDWQN